MNLGSVETFSGLDGMLVTVMLKYERRCVTDEGCSPILLHAGPLLSSLSLPSNAQWWVENRSIKPPDVVVPPEDLFGYDQYLLQMPVF